MELGRVLSISHINMVMHFVLVRHKCCRSVNDRFLCFRSTTQQVWNSVQFKTLPKGVYGIIKRIRHIVITNCPFRFSFSHLPKPLSSMWVTFCPHFMMTSRQSKTIGKCAWTLVRRWLRYSVFAVGKRKWKCLTGWRSVLIVLGNHNDSKVNLSISYQSYALLITRTFVIKADIFCKYSMRFFSIFHLLRWNISLKLALHHDENKPLSHKAQKYWKNYAFVK